MAERMGRVGRRGDDSEAPIDAVSDDEPRGDRGRGRGLTSLLALAASGFILYVAWWLLWEGSHPAASAARGVYQGDPAGRSTAIRDLAEIGSQDPEVAVPALIQGLADELPGNRAAAADALAAAIPGGGAAGPGPDLVREALNALLGRFGDPEAAVRARAVYALCAIVQSWHGSPMAIDLPALDAEMTRLADSPEAVVRSAAVQGLAALAHGGTEPPPPRLIAALDDESEAVRSAATQGLARFHPGMVRMLPSLVAAMMKARPECHSAYLGVLRRSRPGEYPREVAAEMIAALSAALGSPDRRVRAEVATMLGEIGPEARSVIPALLGLLDDPEEPVAPAAGDDGGLRARDSAVAGAQALRQIAGIDWTGRRPRPDPRTGEIVAALLRLSRSPVAGRRLAAVYALTDFEADDAIVAALITAAGDRDEWVRIAAIQALGGRGHRLASRAIEALRRALEDRSPRARAAAAIALSRFGSGVEPMVPALIRHAGEDPDPAARDACATALGALAPPAVSAAVVPLYLDVLERPSAPGPLREGVIAALIPFGREARPAVPAIARALRSAEERIPNDPPPRERSDLGMRTGPLAPFPRPAAEVQVALRRNAARALGVLGPSTPAAGEAVAALAEALADPADEVNLQAGESLAAFGPAAREAIPALLDAMRSARDAKNPARAGRMAEAIGRIDPAAPGAGEAIDFLDEALRSDDVLARLFAERVLVVYGPAAEPTVPALVMLARRGAIRSSPELSSVVEAIGRIAPGTPAAEAALAALVPLLRAEPEVPGLEAVVDAVGRFGPGAAAALPHLRELETSAIPMIAAAARKAAAAVGVDDARAQASGGPAVRGPATTSVGHSPDPAR